MPGAIVRCSGLQLNVENLHIEAAGFFISTGGMI
jgi:hypothetical protein